MGMQTPDQIIEEVELFLKNLKTDGFTVQHLVDLLDVLNKAETVIGHKLLTSHNACGND